MAVGDECIILGVAGENKHQPNIPFEYRKLAYDRLQNQVYSPAMMTYVTDKYAFMGYFPTPQCDKPFLNGRDERPECYYVDIEGQNLKKLDEFSTEHISIPMDFNGTEVAWLT